MENNKKPKLTLKRRLIQLYAALLTNANIKGFATGEIFKGNSKTVCVPGINCYSCPGAVGACPLGSLQNALIETKKSTLFYMFGIILLYCIMFGRWICGFLCPFGLIQDLLYKIKSPKLKKNKVTRVLSYFKYVVLVFFVFIIPIAYTFRDKVIPAFCKYICPAGTLGGAIPLLLHPSNEEEIFPMLGFLFTWKFALMISIVVGAVFIYRLFCRFICPLGALYGLFNKISVLGIKLEKNKCVDCGLCQAKCKVDIKHVGDHECINCGECISVCPTKAISWKGSKIILPENEIPENASAEEKEKITAKREKRVFALRLTAAILMVASLVGALVYFNFIYEQPQTSVTPPADSGSSDNENENDEFVVGEGQFNLSKLKGNVVIINFWGTWCGPCIAELPHFNEIASEYKNEGVYVVTVHSTEVGKTEPEEFIEMYYPDSDMIFVRDYKQDGVNFDAYYSLLNGMGSYPMTIVVDKNGIVTDRFVGSVEKSQLVDAITKAKASDTDALLNDPTLREGGKIGRKCYSVNLDYVDVYKNKVDEAE